MASQQAEMIAKPSRIPDFIDAARKTDPLAEKTNEAGPFASLQEDTSTRVRFSEPRTLLAAGEFLAKGFPIRSILLGAG